jgi:CRISPR-associated endonuclease/helicase Cas3
MQVSVKEAFDVAYDKFLEEEEKEERPFLNYVIDELDKRRYDYNVFLIEAPTGYGKTLISATIAYWNLKYGIKSIIAYPLITIIEQHYKKFSNFLSKIANKEILGLRHMLNNQSVYLIKPVTLTTIDTLSLTFFGIPPEEIEKVTKEGTSYGSLGHYFVAWTSIFFSDIVLDEVHLVADSTKSINFLLTLAKVASMYDQKLFLLSATIPESLKKLISNYTRTLIIEYSEEKDKGDKGYSEFLNERRNKKYSTNIKEFERENKFKEIKKLIEEKPYSRKLIIFNTRDEAIEFYNYLNDDKAIILHSHFTNNDKKEKIKEIEKAEKKGEFIIISTQSIEAGVSISSNFLVTDIAPLNSLIQRIGRFLRGTCRHEKEGEINIWYDKDLFEKNDRYKVYNKNLTNETLKILKNINQKINFHDPTNYKPIIDKIYENYYNINEKTIDDFIHVFLSLERAPKEAVELFFNMEGSFVRNSVLIPVTWKEKISKFDEDVIAINIHEFLELLKKGIIKKVIVGDKLKDLSEVKLDTIRINDKQKDRNIKYILMRIFKNNIDAFYANVSYDPKKGLII